jgi:hypothetical protein
MAQVAGHWQARAVLCSVEADATLRLLSGCYSRTAALRLLHHDPELEPAGESSH